MEKFKNKVSFCESMLICLGVYFHAPCKALWCMGGKYFTNGLARIVFFQSCGLLVEKRVILGYNGNILSINELLF